MPRMSGPKMPRWISHSITWRMNACTPVRCTKQQLRVFLEKNTSCFARKARSRAAAAPYGIRFAAVLTELRAMTYRVTFMERTNGAGQPSEFPPDYVAIDL